MKTDRKTRVSFSADRIDLRLPRCWSDLSQKELPGVCRIMAHVPAEHARVAVFLALTKARLTRCVSGESFSCRFRSGRRSRRVAVSPSLMESIVEPLAFLLTPGVEPVRPDRLRGRRAVDPRLHGVTFGKYIELENLYQGYIWSQARGALLSMAGILYPGKPFSDLSAWEEYAVLNWAVQLKGMFSMQFPNFFRPASAEVDAPSMLEVMNNEIRALTGGDIDKEDAVLGCDCWRALTELDFKAKEAEEIRRMNLKK